MRRYSFTRIGVSWIFVLTLVISIENSYTAWLDLTLSRSVTERVNTLMAYPNSLTLYSLPTAIPKNSRDRLCRRTSYPILTYPPLIFISVSHHLLSHDTRLPFSDCPYPYHPWFQFQVVPSYTWPFVLGRQSILSLTTLIDPHSPIHQTWTYHRHPYLSFLMIPLVEILDHWLTLPLPIPFLLEESEGGTLVRLKLRHRGSLLVNKGRHDPGRMFILSNLILIDETCVLS